MLKIIIGVIMIGVVFLAGSLLHINTLKPAPKPENKGKYI